MLEFFIAGQIMKAFTGTSPMEDLLPGSGGGGGKKSGSKYNDGLVHGHCRYGECSCIDVGIWVDRISGRPECFSAPWDVCGCCGGEGAHFNKAGDSNICGACGGVGMVPGPHWPWRFAEPGPLPPLPCPGAPPERSKKKEEQQQSAPTGAGGGGHPWSDTRPVGVPVGGRWVDPHSLDMRGGEINEEAVKFYQNNPNGRFDGGTEWSSPVIYTPTDGGKPFLAEGRHRAEAAIRDGKQLWVEEWRK